MRRRRRVKSLRQSFHPLRCQVYHFICLEIKRDSLLVLDIKPTLQSVQYKAKVLFRQNFSTLRYKKLKEIEKKCQKHLFCIIIPVFKKLVKESVQQSGNFFSFHMTLLVFQNPHKFVRIFSSFYKLPIFILKGKKKLKKFIWILKNQ